MTESSLSIGLPELRQAVGSYLGIGETVSSYDTEELAKVDRCISSGLRLFYNGDGLHQWSFLSPKLELTTTSDQNYVTLPDDFHSITSELFYSDNSISNVPITPVAPEILYDNRQSGSTQTGKPYQYCITASTHTGDTGQRFIMELYYTPDDAYTIYGRYGVKYANKLTDTYPYPKGGMQHAETIIAACLAAAEYLYKNDSAGAKYQLFKDMLQTSLLADQRITMAMNFGYNGDGGYNYRKYDREGSFYYNGVKIFPNS